MRRGIVVLLRLVECRQKKSTSQSVRLPPDASPARHTDPKNDKGRAADMLKERRAFDLLFSRICREGRVRGLLT